MLGVSQGVLGELHLGSGTGAWRHRQYHRTIDKCVGVFDLSVPTIPQAKNWFKEFFSICCFFGYGWLLCGWTVVALIRKI